MSRRSVQFRGANMAIYKMSGNKKELAKVDPTSFHNEGVLERNHLQRMLRDQPDVLEERLLIISEEFGDWQDSKRRIDLLGIDAAGRLVVIELKRGESGELMDLQAIRYAAMVANMTFQQTVATYQAYLEKRADPEDDPVEENAAENSLRERFGSTDGSDPVINTEIPRIILVSENFSKELTTCIMWLNDSWLNNHENAQEIKCIRLEPHKNGDEIFVESSVIIPLPEASNYRIQHRKREQETRTAGPGKTTTVQGADHFLKTIERASEQFQPGLKSLYDTARKMEQEKTAELSTRTNSQDNNCSIDVTVPGTDQKLVSFMNVLQYKGKECGGEIVFWSTWDNLAPKSMDQIEVLIDATMSQNRFRRLSGKKYDWDAILATIREAYQEANCYQTEAASTDD